MKNRFRSLLSVLLVLMLLLSCAATTAQAADEVSINVNAKFMYKEARDMLDMVNAFRTGKEANYIDQDNKTVVNVKGLKKLKYDYNLEKIAMLRALEIAVYFSHTRPNGQKWSSAHSGKYTRGENIAYGAGSTKAAFNAFKEDGKNYSGQGHRRNMLEKKYTRVGFGCVKVGKTVYWAQEFGSGNAGGSASQKLSSTTVGATWKTLKSAKTKINASVKELTLAKGESIDLPKVVLTSGSGAKNSLKNKVTWSSSNTKVAKIKDNKLVAVKAGKAELSISVGGTTLKVPVQVTTKSASGGSLVKIDDYNTPLGTDDVEIFFLDDEEVGFMDEADIEDAEE